MSLPTLIRHLRLPRLALRPAAWLGLAALMLAPAAAFATTYYVSPTGSDANSGNSLGSAWATLTKANTAVRPGDVVRVSDGTYSSAVGPTTTGTPTARITYIGNLSNPAAVTIAGGDLVNVSYITMKGFNINGGVGFVPKSGNTTTICIGDSLAFCRLSSLSFLGAKHCFVGHNVITHVGAYCIDFLGADGEQVPTGVPNCEYDTLRANIITITNIPSDGRGIKFCSRTQQCVIDSNVVSFTFSATVYTGRAYGFRLMHSYYNKFTDNQFTASTVNQPTDQPWAMYCLRDSVHHNQFLRNTYTTTGSYPIEIFQSQSGASEWSNDTRQNRWDHCRWTIRTPTPGLYSGLYWQDGINSDTLTNCVIQNNDDAAMRIADVRMCTMEPGRTNLSLIDHNTFYGIARANVSGIMFDVGSASFEPGSSLTFTNNIVYTNSSGTGSTWNSGTAVRIPAGASFRSDRNLISHYAGASRAIFYLVEGGSTGYAAPGSSGAMCTSGTSWGWPSGADCNSIYGSPQFQDSSRTSFDPSLRSGSIARGAGSAGTDIGAVPFASSGPDVVPPSTVTNLAAQLVSDQLAILTWSAPGDDGMSGIAAAYDLRWSNAPITSANFASAQAVTVPPVPLAGGTQQSYVMMGLSSSTQYYFALRSRDEAGNWSGTSNSLPVATTSSDQVPPTAVRDLSTGP